jgi:hypothetical protein
MITIKAITSTLKSIDENGNTIENIVLFPKRELTEQEKQLVLSVTCDGENYIYLLKN